MKSIAPALRVLYVRHWAFTFPGTRDQAGVPLASQRADSAAPPGRCWQADAAEIGDPPAQKAGTTLLFNYLSQHQQAQPPMNKEIHYFDLNFARRPTWYRTHFPQRSAPGIAGAEEITFDCSPCYPFRPAVPE